MKITTSITLDIGYENESEDLKIEISEDFSEYTCFKIKESCKKESIALSVPNNKLRYLVNAINEHIRIHGI